VRRDRHEPDPTASAPLLKTFAPVIGCSEEKILRYAIAHAGLSISWALEDGLPIASGSDASERLAYLSVAKRMLDGLPVRP
jgi:streptomycin 6-kinase